MKELRLLELLKYLNEFSNIYSIYKIGSFDVTLENDIPSKDLDLIIVTENLSEMSKAEFRDKVENHSKELKILLDLIIVQFEDIVSIKRSDTNISANLALLKETGENIFGKCIKELIPELRVQSREKFFKNMYDTSFLNIREYGSEEDGSLIKRRYLKSWPIYLSYLYLYKNDKLRLLDKLGKDHLYKLILSIDENDNLLNHAKDLIRLKSVLSNIGIAGLLDPNLENQIMLKIIKMEPYLGEYEESLDRVLNVK